MWVMRIVRDISPGFLVDHDEFQTGLMLVRPHHPREDIHGSFLLDLKLQFEHGMIIQRPSRREAYTSAADIDRRDGLGFGEDLEDISGSRGDDGISVDIGFEIHSFVLSLIGDHGVPKHSLVDVYPNS